MLHDPYFRHIASQKRLCPSCHNGILRIEECPGLEHVAALEICDLCGYHWQLRKPGAKFPKSKINRTYRIIKPDFGKKGKR